MKGAVDGTVVAVLQVRAITQPRDTRVISGGPDIRFNRCFFYRLFAARARAPCNGDGISRWLKNVRGPRFSPQPLSCNERFEFSNLHRQHSDCRFNSSHASIGRGIDVPPFFFFSPAGQNYRRNRRVYEYSRIVQSRCRDSVFS